MRKQNTTIFFSILLFSFATISKGLSNDGKHKSIHGNVKLFVFGDSYVDTGNFNKSLGGSWAPPYGHTFPGKPDGRFSNGLILTDYIASFLGIETPITYVQRNNASKAELQHGVNFAYGGTGVFETLKGPNLTVQINQFRNLIDQKVYNKNDLSNSVALVSAAGNDYAYYLHESSSGKEIRAFTKKLIEEFEINLMLLKSTGIGKIAVGALEPAGCLPLEARELLYKKCNEKLNEEARFHNLLLNYLLKKLDREAKKTVFILVDLYNAFLKGQNQLQKRNAGNPDYKNPLKPCWNSEIDKKSGKKEFVICKHPELSFYWDLVHPTQSAWHSVYLTLKPSLKALHG